MHPAPCLCQAACGVKYGWGGRLGSQRGGQLLRRLHRQKYKPIYFRARVGQSHNSSRQEAELNVTLHPTSHQSHHFTLHLNWEASPRANSERPRVPCDETSSLWVVVNVIAGLAQCLAHSKYSEASLILLVWGTRSHWRFLRQMRDVID